MKNNLEKIAKEILDLTDAWGTVTPKQIIKIIQRHTGSNLKINRPVRSSKLRLDKR